MLRKFLLCFAAGVTALSLGLAVFYAGEYLVSIFQTSEREIVETKIIPAVEPERITVEELIYPKLSAQVEPKEQETEPKEQEDESDIYGFDPGGEYYLIGGANKRFYNFDGFFIKTMKYGADPETDRWMQEAITPEGYTYKEAGKELKFVRLFISEKHIAFETESESGISYRFEGKFVEGKEVEYKGETDYAVIEGFLIKLKNGREIVRRVAHYGQVSGC
ncbi:hypothetical protein BH20ACI4_BH20ACI4_14680 [soil metagenome]